MKNVNRDYLVKVDAKTAAIDPPIDMKFFVTDRYTCNIFFQLIVSDTDASFKNAPEENASKYTLTLRIVKPNNEYIDNIKTTFMYQSGNAFYYVADLIPDYTNVIGVCQCELFIETTINGRLERSTTEPFEYEVEKSIFNFLDEVIESNPDYPLVDTLATKDYIDEAMRNIDLSGYATRDYVNQVVSSGGMDLSYFITDDELNIALSKKANSSHTHDNYVTDQELNGELANKANSNHTHDNYATKSYVDDAIANADIGGDVNLDNYVTEQELAEALVNFSGGGSVDLSAYVTEEELTEALTYKANANHYHNEYATHNYVDEVVEFAITNGNINLDDYVTGEEFNGALANKADSEHTHDEYVTDTELIAKDYATKDQIPASLPANGGNSTTVGGYSIWVGSQAEYSALTSIETDMLYFIEEEDE